jgi:hypothetical protein
MANAISAAMASMRARRASSSGRRNRRAARTQASSTAIGQNQTIGGLDA